MFPIQYIYYGVNITAQAKYNRAETETETETEIKGIQKMNYNENGVLYHSTGKKKELKQKKLKLKLPVSESEKYIALLRN